MLKKTTRLTLVDQVIVQLEAMIESGDWTVGEKIPPEPELIAKLQVSRNTLREGIKALCHAGVLVTRQGDGTYVSSRSALGAALQRRAQQSGLLETLEVRQALEREAARLSAVRRTDEDIARIRHYQQLCREYARSGDIERYVETDLCLHQSIVEATGNAMLVELYSHMTDAVRESIMLSPHRKTSSFLHADKHQLLIEAIIEGDEEKAGQAVLQDIAELKQAWEEEESS
ncbi:transcriptional regulator, GntR family [Paenibacillus sp. UNCCL117]|uniref:FadR/GntR family transcriptional regulator n=1 Tax=unclassified Paenibacillus TaxID=185978 RepID=UPI0008811386|nr:MULTISPECIES: FadR/GntR family transcriptional regulator [unclassified Paenibacillus]SDE62415.1 DNA-binding transcriptional regulator, FadR family [Paenibacillus sp. cl123]SFW69938.1 transcriptional regulator, GntR family [Paenibacillus sp. UNCCL117]